MKPIMRKIAQLKGVTFTGQDIQDAFSDMEYICYLVEGEFSVRGSDALTIKVKGKVVEPKDLAISFEEE